MTPSHATPCETARDTLTLKAAAARAGVSVSTVRRRKDALLAAGATVDPSGWVIPVAALEAVFLAPPERAHDTPADTPVDTPADTPVDTSSDTPLVEQLRAENARLWEQVEQQARTIERQAEAHAVISAQLTKLGQLEAGTAQPASAPDEQPAPRRRWWQRRNPAS